MGDWDAGAWVLGHVRCGHVAKIYQRLWSGCLPENAILKAMEIIVLTVVAILLAGYLGFSVAWRYASRQHSWMDSADSLSFYQARADKVVQARIQKRLDRVLEAARTAGRITNDDVEDMFCIGDRTASRYLRQLVAAGQLERHGANRGTYYVPTAAGRAVAPTHFAAIDNPAST